MPPVQQLHLAGPVFQGVSSTSVAGKGGHHASPLLCILQQGMFLKHTSLKRWPGQSCSSAAKHLLSIFKTLGTVPALWEEKESGNKGTIDSRCGLL